MRRILPLFLVLLLLCPPAAALTLPYPEATVLSVTGLTDAQRDLAAYLYAPIFRGDEDIPLPNHTRYQDVCAAMNALMQDYPELFHLARDYSVSYYRSKPEEATSVQPSYRMSAEDAAAARSALYREAYLLVSACHSAEEIHDALCARVTYGGDAEMRHTAVGALLQGQATCEGYAQALTLLYRLTGIPCGVVTGIAADEQGAADRHSWNIARLQGFTLIDPTWNDQDALGMITHWYYGLSTAQMGVDHTPDEGLVLPPCGEQDNWHRVRGAVITTWAEADAALRRLTVGETLNLRIPDAALYASLALETHATLSDYNERYPAEAFYGAYRLMSSAAQQCLILLRAE